MDQPVNELTKQTSRIHNIESILKESTSIDPPFTEQTTTNIIMQNQNSTPLYSIYQTLRTEQVLTPSPIFFSYPDSLHPA